MYITLMNTIGILLTITMIDTIRTTSSSLPLAESRETEVLRNEVSEWATNTTETFLSHLQKNRTSVSATHRPTGFRVHINDGIIETAEGSIPRMMDRPNGIQLRDPADLHAGLGAFIMRLRFLNKKAKLCDLRITRLDLVLNLPLDPRMVLAVHRIARHPRIRRETELYHNDPPGKAGSRTPHYLSTLNTVRFNGAHTTISIYDKVRQVLGCKGRPWPEHSNCTRVEIQLKSAKHIAKVLGSADRGHITLDQLDFEQCYRAYRDILLQFEQLAAMPEFKPDLASCLAIMERYPETWQSLGGMQPLDWYHARKAVTADQYRHTRNKVRKLQLQLNPFRWSDHLPEDRLPDLVDVDEDGNETLIPSPYSFPGAAVIPAVAPAPAGA